MPFSLDLKLLLGDSSVGQQDSSFHKKSGPRSHLPSADNLDGSSPLEASSAGFKIPGTYLHSPTWEFSLISWTLLATKVWKRRLTFLR